MSNQFDNNLFRFYAEEFFGDLAINWMWFTAQAIQESELNPLAVSPGGAMGLMQLMPGTSAEMAKRLKICDSPHDPSASWPTSSFTIHSE